MTRVARTQLPFARTINHGVPVEPLYIDAPRKQLRLPPFIKRVTWLLRQLFAIVQSIAEPLRVLSTTDNRRKTKKNRGYFNVGTIIDFLFKLIKCIKLTLALHFTDFTELFYIAN